MDANDKKLEEKTPEEMVEMILSPITPEYLNQRGQEDLIATFETVLRDLKAIEAGPAGGRPAPIKWSDWLLPDPPGMEMKILAGAKIQPGALTIIAARPGVGKSLLLVNIAIDLLLKGESVSFYTFEEAAKTILDKLIVCAWASEAPMGKDYYKFEEDPPLEVLQRSKGNMATTPDGFLEPLLPMAMKEGIEKVRGWIESGQLKVYSDLQSVVTLEGEIAQKEDHFAIVDYIQRIPPAPDDMSASRQVQIQQMLQRIVRASIASGRFTITAAQVLRDRSKKSKEFTEENWPEANIRLEDLRESGDLEQEANVIVGVSNYENVSGPRKPLTVQIIKDRSGSRLGRTGHLVHYGNGWRVETTKENYHDIPKSEAMVDVGSSDDPPQASVTIEDLKY